MEGSSSCRKQGQRHHHRKGRQRARDAASKARRLSRKEAKKPWELISLMKSQNWFPQEGSVRRLLCADPSCPICNAVALDIQQMLASENISPTASGPSQGSSCLEILSKSSLSFEQRQCFQLSKELSGPSATPSMSQPRDKKSLLESVAQPTGAVSIQDYWAERQARQRFQVPDMSWDAEALSSSSPEECGIPGNQKDKKSSTECVSEKQEAAEAGLGNTMKHFPHSINPKVKGQVHKESVLLSKDETVIKTTTKKAKTSPSSTKDPVRRVKLEKTTEDKNSTFSDADQCMDNDLQQHPLQCPSHSSSKHCPQLTCAAQPKIHPTSQLSPQQETPVCTRYSPILEEKEFKVSQTSASP